MNHIKIFINRRKKEYDIKQSNKIMKKIKTMNDEELTKLNNDIDKDINIANKLGDKIPSLVHTISTITKQEIQKRNLNNIEKQE